MLSREEAKLLVDKNIGSLETLCKRAICTADFNLMQAMGFPERASKRICDIVKSKAKEFGITDLEEHYNNSVSGKRSNLINLIIRKEHKVYYATRSSLHPLRFLSNLEAGPADLCSVMFDRALSRADEFAKKRRELVSKLREANQEFVQEEECYFQGELECA